MGGNMKSGYKTTEFWLALAAMLLGALATSGVFDSLADDHWLPKVVGLITSVLGALGYGAIRMGVKNGEAKAKALADVVKKDPS